MGLKPGTPPARSLFLATAQPLLACSQPPPQGRPFSCSSKKKDYKKKDAAQTPRGLGAPKPEFRMAIKILCGSERACGFTVLWVEG